MFLVTSIMETCNHMSESQFVLEKHESPSNHPPYIEAQVSSLSSVCEKKRETSSGKGKNI